ncbi:hypothetical protein A2U01_0082086, partial [Trifolium medium]|nr:hypothetical protein [Trifolium medium]
AATEEEVEQEDTTKGKCADVVEDSQSEESVEKTVSLGDEDTESEKTVTEDQGATDLDEVESMDEPQASSAQE